MGLDWLDDTQVTKGTFLMAKKGMFGRLLISEPYKTFTKEVGVGDLETNAIFTYVPQIHMPKYIMAGSGI
jgi:hypothetical protein